MKRTSIYYSTFIFVVLTLSCVKQPAFSAATAAKISVMTYNVENLFDTEHDQGKLDYTFLPLAEKKKSKSHQQECEKIKVHKWKEECLYLDWSEKNLDQKMKNTAVSILQVNDGKGPDVLIMQEVENKKVLETLVKKYLKKAGYTSVHLVEGRDTRGIDPAIITRLPVVGEAVLHEIPFASISDDEKKDTRGILEVNVKLPDDSTMTVYSDHFPAPFHKKEFRIQAYQYLGTLMEQKGKDAIQVAGGDFNTPGDEDRKHHLLDENVEPHWIIAHRVGYKGTEGSSYYPKDKTWSFLDMLLLSKNLNDGKGWDWNPASFQIANKAKSQLTEDGIPQSFDPATGKGMSDHLPLYLEIEKLK